jgi:RecA/RadA recombinase
MKNHISSPHRKKNEYDGNTEIMIPTGNTLLDLAISGGRIRGGGLCGGIMVEIFGPSSSGKTALLLEIGGGIQRQGGEINYDDTEARLYDKFAKKFDVNLKEAKRTRSSTVTESFKRVYDWEPKNLKVINGIFTDSLAALSTDMEMNKKDGDKMGGRRAKELSQETRKLCRIISQKNYLMVCSNQIRQVMDAQPFQEKFISPGGEAYKFYSSVRLRTNNPSKIKEIKKIRGKDVTQYVGIETRIDVYKNSTWEPYHSAPLYFIFDYGIDDIRGNLQYVKDFSKNKIYTVNGKELSDSMNESIAIVEEENLELELKEEVIDLWEFIQSKFRKNRKIKMR